MADESNIAEFENAIAEHQEAIQTIEAFKAQNPNNAAAYDQEIAERQKAIKKLGNKIRKVKAVKAAGKVAGAAGTAGKAAAGAAGAVAGAAGAAAANSYNRRKANTPRSSGGLFHRTKKGYSNLNDRFEAAQTNTWNGIKDTASALDHHAHPWIMAIIALLLHAWDATNNFSVAAGHRSVMFILYAFFTLWMIFVYYKTGFSEGSGRYIGISVVAWALPYLLKISFLGNNPYFTFGLLIVPVWFLYLCLHEDNRLLKLCGKTLLFIYALLLVLVLIFFVTGRDLLPDLDAPAVQVGTALNKVWTDIKDVSASAWERIVIVFNPGAWKQRINQTFNPTAAYYAGQVEENKREPHGVFITKLESLYPITYIGTEPSVLGRIEALTFIEGGLELTPSCRLERAGRDSWKGNPDVDPPIMVNRQLVRDVLCTYPVVQNMTPGSYNAVMGVSFDFETWAYMTNTFVSHDVITQYRQQGKDINRELDIPLNNQAIYTNGPVMIGMHNTVQPIDVNPDARTPVQQRFGFTIDDRWDQGKFAAFTSADILVSEPFLLEECAPVTPSIASQEDGIRTYRFVPSPEWDPRTELRTVTCQLVIPDRAAALELIGYGEKTPVTFVVKAKYKYEIEKHTRVRIEE